jgi:hypothetical protein
MSGTDRTRTFHQAAKTKGSSFRRDAKTKSPRRPLQRLDHPSHKAMARQAERSGYRITSSRKSLRLSPGLTHSPPLTRPLGLPIYVASSRLGSILSFFPAFLIRIWKFCNHSSFDPVISVKGFIVMAISNRLKSLKAWLRLLGLGCALFSSACANDEGSSADSSQHHRHHGGGGGRYGHGQGGMFDQSNPSGSQSTVPGE